MAEKVAVSLFYPPSTLSRTIPLILITSFRVEALVTIVIPFALLTVTVMPSLSSPWSIYRRTSYGAAGNGSIRFIRFIFIP